MRNTMIVMTLALALVAGACAADVTESDEYQALENELATVERQLSGTATELEAAKASQNTTNTEVVASSARHDAALEGINRMSDYCGECRFDPGKRTGDDACPFTTLYWDFLDRNRERLQPNARLARQYHTLDRLSDMDAVRARAEEVVTAASEGRL